MWLRSYSNCCQSILYPSFRRQFFKEGKNLSSKAPLSYQELQTLYRGQAKRTVQIQHPECDPVDVLTHIDSFGTVKSAFSYHCNEKDYMLVEFGTEKEVHKLLQSTAFFPNDQQYAISSRSLYYKQSKRARRTRPSAQGVVPIVSHFDSELREEDLLEKPGLSEEILALHERIRHTDLSIRLRHFIAGCVEDFLHRLFPMSCITLFGSSVNGLGTYNCDLDMTLEMGGPPRGDRKGRNPNGQMYFLTKTKLENGRLDSQRALEACGGMIQSFFPQSKDVQKILRARVPIVKFSHFASGVECDLTISNDSAVAMAELLFNLGQCDVRMRPLVFTVRHWARSNGLSFSNPGPWPSSFMLTMLVLHFLQTRFPPVLPPLNRLRQRAGQKRPEEEETMAFTSDWRRFPRSQNTESLGELLRGFFAFYATFDFEQHGISVLEGEVISKADGAAMYLEYPFEREMNCSKNVMASHLTLLQEGCQAALDTLDSLPSDLDIGESRLLRILTTCDVTPSSEESDAAEGDVIADPAIDHTDDVTSGNQISDTSADISRHTFDVKMSHLFAETEQQPIREAHAVKPASESDHLKGHV